MAVCGEEFKLKSGASRPKLHSSYIAVFNAMGMAAAAVKEAPLITEHHSLQLTRNLLRIAIFHISYIRGLFPDAYFRDTHVESLDMKVKKLLPMDLESRRLIDWMEKGVYDALKMKYLKTMLFTLCEGEDGPALEEYSFSFNYSTTSEEVSMQVTKNGHVQKTLITGSGAEMNHEQMRKSACKMMRTLVTLMHTLDGVPEERTILVKLYYYDDLTPAEYEPPFFRSCTFDDKKQWLKPPLRIKAGEVNSEFITFSLKVKSTLDPCGDEIDQDSTCAAASSSVSEASTDSDNGDQDCESKDIQDDTEICTSKLLTLADATEHLLEDDDVTQDLKQEMSNLEIFREWVLCRPGAIFHITDILANFPEISEQHTEELLRCMVKEEFLVDLGKDNYKINNQKAQVDDYYEAEKGQPCEDETQKEMTQEDPLYLKALYYALTLEYITISHLQSSLGKNVNFLATRKLIERMVNEGYVEATPVNRKTGRRVIHSEKTSKKLQELKDVFNSPEPLLDQVNQKAHELEKLTLDASPNYVCLQELQGTYAEDMDVSTCGVLQSFGSELTRQGAASPLALAHKEDQIVSSADPKISKRANSRESHLNKHSPDGIFSPSKQKLWSKRGFQFCGSQETWEKDPPRKASMVEEPIYQKEKRICRDSK
ncbi:hypothetical protein GOP47_0019851 [Adiantum capillus-veneris]|uniref:HORMA domain-containing protein n=1 Tax=Adiantum capillus-veneris TaxID=13818 RepID=A0A9D4ZA13_ADICA|nr:hypothetical protein GOP47_0019851 [Adiantum capillus-veneris]